MTTVSGSERDLPKFLAHPLTIAASCAGTALFAVLSYRTLLGAIPSDCMRGSVLRVLPAIASMCVLALVLMLAVSGIWHRLRPKPTWPELVWAEAFGPGLTHAVLFGVYVAVYVAVEVPADCASPSLVELGAVGVCQLAHIAFLMRRAARLAALMREDA